MSKQITPLAAAVMKALPGQTKTIKIKRTKHMKEAHKAVGEFVEKIEHAHETAGKSTLEFKRKE